MNTLHHGDCLTVLPTILSNSVDLILCDLPYGTTQNKWDTVIPLDKLWEQYMRVVKPNAAIVLTASQPFTSTLVQSNLAWFKYDWVWHKEKGTGHLNAKKQPLRDKEDILVFYKNQPTYNPQFTVGTPYSGAKGRNLKKQTASYGAYAPEAADNSGFRYPRQVLAFQGVGRGGIHPTQKPTPLMEYLIRTYTNPGDVVLDNCMGSGTTGVAAVNTGRQFIGIELDADYYNAALGRINNGEVKEAV